ncbi:MAG: hypothetical protein HY791_17050 [Deltaproteobacteria bacterium]|nr:hypothetical protein [Deltaproteobacteria bacterium]
MRSIALVTLLMFGSEASAQTDRERAKALLDEGNRLLRGGDAPAAIEKYEAAYAAFASPKILFNLAKAQQKVGRELDAARTLDRLLLTAPGDDKSRGEAAKELASLEEKLGRLKVAGPAGFTVILDGDTWGTLPVEPIRVQPGAHVVRFEGADALPLEKSVQAGAGRMASVEVELTDFAHEPVAAIDRTEEPSSEEGASPTPPIEAAPAKPPYLPPTVVEETSVISNPWFWGTIAFVAAAGASLAIGLASQDAAPDDELGSTRFSDWEK